MRDRHRQNEEIRIGIRRLAPIFQYDDTRTKCERNREQLLGSCEIGEKPHCLNL